MREAIFKLSQTLEDSEPDEAIVLPCKTSRRILVYGGHDSWRKQIQEFLPDVTFFDKDMLVDQYETAHTAVENLQNQREHRLNKADSIGTFMFELKEYDNVLEKFDDQLWIKAIDTLLS